MVRLVCVVQGVYYLMRGLWPLVSMDTFVAVTGPKTDLWLVDAVSVLVTVLASVLLFAAARHQITSAIWLLAIASAAALMVVESFYALRGVIWAVHLLDAVLEVGLIALWIIALFRARHAVTGGAPRHPHPVR
ncbi:MAG TPA: hypothetical protein VFL57_07085 [Bryobacteraceae bacterium]|nr:hypothetical protein [Bryobacteraceae bacterium]